MRLRILAAIFLLWAFPVYGATIWVNPAGSATAPYDTKEKGLTTIQAGTGAMSANDTLTIADGTYQGATNMIDIAHKPPNGTGGNYTTIQAETRGGVFIDGQGARAPVNLDYDPGVEYIIFNGIKFGNSNAHVFRVGYSNHVKVLNCAAFNSNNGNHLFSAQNSSYILYEDCWAWGHAQYAFHYRVVDHSIARRCVSRIDWADANDAYVGSFFNYQSSDMEWQNCILIDSDQSSYLDDNAAGAGGIFGYWSQTNETSENVYNRGCIALNSNTGTVGAFHAGEGGAIESSHFYEDCVVWGALVDGDNFYSRANSTATNPPYNHCLVGGNANASGRGFYCSGGSEGDVSNSIVNGINGTSYTFLNSVTNCVSYTDGTDSSNIGTTTNLDTTTNPLTNGLLYLTRIETGSALASQNGERIGPAITKKIGTSGTLWGETGYATTTDDNLWPWPNEALIKSDFATDNHETIVEARGFAAAGKQLNGTDDITLTSYIWEYLGNEMPADVYGSVSATSTGIGGTGIGWQ